MTGAWDSNRTVLKISGSDAHKFLQDLVTNDVDGAKNGLVYAALLSPQGKYLFDFFLLERGGAYLLDVSSDTAQPLAQRLTMYKLRADVQIEDSGLVVNRGVGEAPAGSFNDPRHPDMGWRTYETDQGGDDAPDWTALRVAAGVPATGVELRNNDSYILECGFEALNGVDFRKGCYVGQEVTARMKHKTELRKGLRKVVVDGEVPVGTEITSNGKPAGTLYSQSEGQGIAYLRLDRVSEDMQAGDARVSLV